MTFHPVKLKLPKQWESARCVQVTASTVFDSLLRQVAKMASALVSLFTLVAMVIVTECVPQFPWINEYDEPMNFLCPNKQIMMYLSSDHDNGRGDRIWEMYCRSADLVDNCQQSDYVNEFDQTFNYTCPGNRVLAGIHSYHENSKEDRRFKFTCCRASSTPVSGCRMTDFVNDWNLKLTMFVKECYAIKTIYSINDDNKKDRRFKFGVCKL
nr:dermatopontin-like [Biomphalaria glabrata]